MQNNNMNHHNTYSSPSKYFTIKDMSRTSTVKNKKKIKPNLKVKVDVTITKQKNDKTDARTVNLIKDVPTKKMNKRPSKKKRNSMKQVSVKKKNIQTINVKTEVSQNANSFTENSEFCSVCKKYFSGPIPAKEHYAGIRHRNKLKTWKPELKPSKRENNSNKQCSVITKNEGRKKNSEFQNVGSANHTVTGDNIKGQAAGKKVSFSEDRKEFSRTEHTNKITTPQHTLANSNLDTKCFRSFLNPVERELYEISRAYIISYLTKNGDPTQKMKTGSLFSGIDAVELLTEAIKFSVLDSFQCNFCSKKFTSKDLCVTHLADESHNGKVNLAKVLFISGTFLYEEEFQKQIEIKKHTELKNSKTVPVTKISTLVTPQPVSRLWEDANCPSSFQTLPVVNENIDRHLRRGSPSLSPGVNDDRMLNPFSSYHCNQFVSNTNCRVRSDRAQPSLSITNRECNVSSMQTQLDSYQDSGSNYRHSEFHSDSFIYNFCYNSVSYKDQNNKARHNNNGSHLQYHRNRGTKRKFNSFCKDRMPFKKKS